MATAANGRLRETVEFDLNVPVELALKYPAGKVISTRNGERVMFTTADDRVMFLDLGPAQKINALGANVGEKIVVCRRKNGNAPAEWGCWLHPDTEKARAQAEEAELAKPGKLGERGDGTFAIPKPPHQPAPALPEEEDPLVAEANSLVDAFAVVMDRALRKYEGRIKPDEIRSLLLSAYIQRSKGGGR